MSEQEASLAFFFLTVFTMVLGFLGHILKKVVEARRNDETFHIKTYLKRYPYATGLAFFTAIGGYLMLMSTDNLTALNAFMAGYMANSVGDIADPSRKGK